MDKKKIIFWVVIVLIIVGILLFMKFNPLYATFEVTAAFFIGLFGEAIVKWIYDKWVKA